MSPDTNNRQDLEGKVALVTGGGTGIGRATARAFAHHGAEVVIAGPDDGNGAAAVDEIEAAGGKALFVAADVTKASDAEAMVAAAVDRFGGLDVAFNNAGMEASTSALADVTEEEWDKVTAVNVKGVFLSIKYEVPAMQARGGGAIVNASSVLGLVGSSNGALYAATKHAVSGITRCAALDYAPSNIRVNATAPGMIDTPMIDRTAVNMGVPKEAFGEAHPLGRVGRPEEIAEAVVWLCSDRSSFVTGTVLSLDGGWTAQ
jgi:NAD(P)-dependent dehydrogenase (short-subunit alcohol dehydrogenase family)